MTIKKLLSGVLCASMLLSSFTFASANEAPTSADSWNYNLVSESSKDLYADFPMIINKSIGKDMSLSMQFQYLKNISADDTVEITITDLSDNSVVENYELTEDNNFIIWNDVENNKYFSISVAENINGVENMFNGYINTKFVPTDFPVNMTLGNKEYALNNGEEFSAVAIKKIGVHANCDHDDDTECVATCKTSGVLDLLAANELDTFYSSLDDNSYYEMQVEASLEGQFEHYQGFISTYPGGEDLGVFTRGYTFSLNPVSPVSVASVDPYGIATAAVTPDDYDFSTAYEYVYYRNENISSLDYDSELMVKWVVPETGSYTIETIGNVDTMWYEFTVNNDTGDVYDTVYTRRTGGTGGNVSRTISILEGQIKYFVLNLEDGDVGPCAFRIIRNDISNMDSIPAYRDEVQANYDNGIFSSITNPNCTISYNGDVNVFAYDVSKGNGYLQFSQVGTPLTIEIYTIYDRVGGFDKLWKESTLTAGNYAAVNNLVHNFSKEIHYIDIKQTSVPATTSEDYFSRPTYTYNFNFFDPRKKDADDVSANDIYGDSPVHPVNITCPYTNNTRTLHRGESDWFVFTAESAGDLTVKLNKATNGNQYDVALYDEIEIDSYDPPAWYIPTNIGSVESYDSYQELTYSGLVQGKQYYIEVDRPDSNTYSSVHPYTIEVYVTSPNPTAVLANNVILSYVKGTATPDISSFKNSVMDQMTCTLYGENVDDSVAVDDVELYYNNNVLTSDVVSNMSVGTYNIVPKYQGVAATGGTVTLNVSEQIVEQVEVSIPTPYQYTVEFDGLTCAQVLANLKLANDNQSATTLDVSDVAALLNIDEDYPERTSRSNTFKATCYFYTNGTSASSNAFINLNNATAVSEDALYDMIDNGNVAIMHLADSTDKTNKEKMRYVIICGVNKTTHQLKVYDCLEYNQSNRLRWVSTSSIFDGGYISSNSNVKFSGSIIVNSEN